MGSITAGLLGRKLGSSGSQVVTIGCLAFASLFALLAFYEVAVCASPVLINLGSWINSDLLTINWLFYFDQLTVTMLVIVSVVSLAVHIYSVYYMTGEPHQQRFFSYLSLFTFFMLVLVSGGNYLVLFLGWEGIGVSSYLLINYYYTRLASNKAAILAFNQNRVGDWILSVGFFALIATFGSLDFDVVFSLAPSINPSLITLICVLIFIGAGAKSSVLGLHSWLPGSMEAPTPVSSLLHAATLVTAGLYLLIRSSPLLEYSPTTLFIITIMGALTAIFAATSGLLQNDIKRIIAFSTISQLGYMFIAIGLSQYNVALFHLMTHSTFKALLFLGAGCVIHAMNNQQDVRKLGGLIGFLPFVYTAMLIGSLSLMALPWLSGFYSKDLILEMAFGTYTVKGYIAWVFGTFTAGLTAFYSFRLIVLTFLGVPAAPVKSYNNVHEPSTSAIVSLVFLALCSIFLGYFTSDAFVGIGSNFLDNSIFIHPNNIAIVEAEFALPLIIKLAPAILTVLGAVSAVILYLWFPNLLFKLTDNNLGKSLYTFFNGKYLLDILLNAYIIRGGMSLGYTISKFLDRGAFEYLGPNGLSILNSNLSAKLNKLDDGTVTNYASYMIISILFINLLLFTYLIVNSSELFNVNYPAYFAGGEEWILARYSKTIDNSTFGYLGPFELFNPAYSVLYPTEIPLNNIDVPYLFNNELGYYDELLDGFVIQMKNNKLDFLFNAFNAISSTHWLIFYLSLFFVILIKPNNHLKKTN
jgi:NADH-ubiquinone oxidoreductase chain 5